MFEAVQQKLRTIDTVLNEATVEYANRLDVKSGFDPAREYTQQELNELAGKFLCGPEAFKRTEQDGCYFLLEARLIDGNNLFSHLYLRGFDYITESHALVAGTFLDKDLRPTLVEYFEFPFSWPSRPSIDTKTPRTVESKKDGLKLTVTAIGGGKFNLKNNQINLKGRSMDFGPVPTQYQEQFMTMLGLLVQKPTYQGFGINQQ